MPFLLVPPSVWLTIRVSDPIVLRLCLPLSLSLYVSPPLPSNTALADNGSRCLEPTSPGVVVAAVDVAAAMVTFSHPW